MADLSLARRIAVFAAIGVCMSALLSAAAAGVRSEFTGIQWKQLSALAMPLVLPATLPRGFHVAQVQATHGQPCSNCENYRVRYASGRGVVEFSGSTWASGVDADEGAFEARFNSPLWGQGVISTVRDVALDARRTNETCLTAYQAAHGGTSLFLIYKSRYYYAVRACDTSLSAADLARIVETAQIAGR